MRKIGSAFENFAFKAFDFSGRATLLEYWLLMPLIWGFIFFLAWGDAVEIWDFLLKRQVPPLNPLYWDSIVVFFITLIPRISLTVRRLHDSGKSGKWVKLPGIAVVSSLVLTIGIFSAMASTNAMGSSTGNELSMVAIVMAIAFGAGDSAWDVIFATAAAANALGWDAIIALLSEMTAPKEQIHISQGLSNLADGVRNAPTQEAPILLIGIVMMATPFVAAFLHIFFMISPTKPDHDLDSSTPIAGATLRKKGDTSDNPFAGYKYLYDKSPEQEAAHKEAAKQEIKSLYQQRVLGQQ